MCSGVGGAGGGQLIKSASADRLITLRNERGAVMHQYTSKREREGEREVGREGGVR